MTDTIFSIIEKTYPFSLEQKTIWETMKHDMLQEEKLDSHNVYRFDKILSRLGDAHTRMKYLGAPDSVFATELLWNKEQLFWVKDGKSFVVRKINDVPVAHILEQYSQEYLLEILFVKRRILENIKYGRDKFDGDTLKISYIVGETECTEVICKVKMQELKEKIPQEIMALMRKMKSVLVTQTDEDTLYMKIMSFYDKNIVNEFIEELNQNMTPGITNIIIDIRDHAGGYVEQAKELASYVIDRDIGLDYEVMAASGCRERYTIESRKLSQFENKKLWLFLNENTQSSAEYIFARALQLANNGIMIIGTKTAGLSGQAQEFIIDNRFLLSVTTKKYLLPGTDEMDCRGILPTKEINPIFDIKDMSTDCYLEWYKKNKEKENGDVGVVRSETY